LVGLPGPVQTAPAPYLPAAAPATAESDVHAMAEAAARTVALARPLVPWLARGAATVALLAAAVAGGRYLWSVMPTAPARPAPTTAATATTTKGTPATTDAISKRPAAPDPGAGRKGAGSLRVTSTPAGADVLVDGKSRGVTPLTIADVTLGRHEVLLRSDAGTARRTVTVAANETVTIDEAIFSGFITVYSPFDVTITENGRVLRADDRHQIMLPAGAHELRFTNRALAYDAVRQVDVKPGEATNLQLTPDPSLLTVTATDVAEVWLDGARLGDTPLNGAPVPLGSHEIVVKRAAGGERRFAVTIGAKPFTLNVEF
jgi:hypothetical protein